MVEYVEKIIYRDGKEDDRIFLMSKRKKPHSFKDTIREVLFGDSHLYVNVKRITLFDQMLMAFISLSIFVVILDSIESVNAQHKQLLTFFEWFFIIVFTIEYVLRVYSAKRRWKYIFSFYGIVDFIAVFPSYVSLFLAGQTSLFVIRAFRLLRVFRILKLLRYLEAIKVLLFVLRESRPKIIVFLTAVMVFVTFMGALMFFIEGEANGFTSIPRGIYWSIVTITTVGYGDITPQTPMGQMIASFLMIVSYGVIAIPTGIISSSLTKYQESSLTCLECQNPFHDQNAKYCKICGAILASTKPPS